MKFSNPALEAIVVGALLDAEGTVVRSNARSMLDASGLSAADFTNATLQGCIASIISLNERKRPVDAKTVWSNGKVAGWAQNAPIEKLEALSAKNDCTREKFMVHAEHLRRLTQLRGLLAFHRAQISELEGSNPDPATMATALSTFAGAFSAVADAEETGASDVARVIEDWQDAIDGKITPVIHTGIDILDGVDGFGGFVPNLNIIGGLPSIGKSALIAEIIMSCLGRGLTVGLFGLEDGTEWVTRRHLSRDMRMPVGAIGRARLSAFDREQLERSAIDLAQIQSKLLVYRRAGIEPDKLVQQAKHWILNKGAKLIIIDHGGEVRHQTAENRDRYDLAVRNTYAQLRDLAINERVPFVVLCHFNRGTEQSGKPTPKSFAETAYIERMARVALGLWEAVDDQEHLRCTVLKCTEGKRGQTLLIRRDAEHALVHRMGGSVLDESAEVAAQQQKREAKSW